MECGNLANNKPACLCTQPRPLGDTDNTKFDCKHCQRQFHRACMRKKLG